MMCSIFPTTRNGARRNLAVSRHGTRIRVKANRSIKNNLHVIFWICILGCSVCLLRAMQTFIYLNMMSIVREHEEKLHDHHHVLSSTNKVDHIQSIYSAIPPGTAASHQPVPYTYRRKLEVSYNDITLVTQTSLDKFDRLSNMLGRWDGPISCAVYLRDMKEILQLDLLMQQQDEKFYHLVTIHVLLEKEPVNPDYPINLMRNLALFNIETEMFLLIDVDFATSSTAYDYLNNFFLHNKSDRYNILYVLPAFEVFEQGDEANQATVTSIDTVPQTKKDLLSMIPTQKVQIFHKKYVQGHRATQYDQWYKCNPDHSKEDAYEIKYEYGFEPYIAGSKHAIHYFDGRFRGWGMNKVNWLNEANLRGYTFEVLCGAFVVHMYHPEQVHEMSAHTQDLVNYYEKEYWPKRYKYFTNHNIAQKLGNGEVWHDIEEYKSFHARKNNFEKCKEKHTTSADAAPSKCFDLASDYIESAISWSKVAGESAGLDLDTQLKTLVEAEECVFFLSNDKKYDTHVKVGNGAFQILAADLYMNLGNVEKKRHDLLQASVYFKKALTLSKTQ